METKLETEQLVELDHTQRMIADLHGMTFGWAVHIVHGHTLGLPSTYFYAYRAGHSDQRADTFNELAKRCAWEERRHARN